MNPASVDVKDMLVADSALGLVFSETGGGNLFIGKEPPDPKNCVTVFDTPGGPPQLTFVQGEDFYYPSIQVRVRNGAYLVGWQLANKIMVSLHARAQETWNGTLYSLIQSSGSPFLLDWDESKRARFVVNFDLQRR